MPNSLATLTLKNNSLGSYLSTGWDIHVASDTITINQTSSTTTGEFDFFIDLPAGKKVKQIDFQYRGGKKAVDFFIQFETDTSSTQRVTHHYGLLFVMSSVVDVHFMTYELLGEGKKKKAVSTDPDNHPIYGIEYGPFDLINENAQVPGFIDDKVFNDWDVYVLSGHLRTPTSTGTRVQMSILIDRPSLGRFDGLINHIYYPADNLVEFIFAKHSTGGATGSDLTQHGIDVNIPGVNASDIHYYGFKYSDENNRKKVVSADPDNHPIVGNH